jgi:hypothetical protein
MKIFAIALALVLAVTTAVAQQKQKGPRGPSTDRENALEDLKAFRDPPPVPVSPPGHGVVKGDTWACMSPSALDRQITASIMDVLNRMVEAKRKGDVPIRKGDLPVLAECATTLLKDAPVHIEYRSKAGEVPVICVRPPDSARCLWVISEGVDVE